MRVKTLALIRSPKLGPLWWSQVASAVGDQLYGVAMVWLAVQLGGGKAAWVIGAQSMSVLVFGLAGGAVADRWDRRKVMAFADLARAVAVLAVPVLVSLHRLALWHLGAVGVVVGALNSIFDPALQATLPGLVADASELQAATALMDSTKRLARVLGPGFTGALLALVPLPHFFTLDSVSFLCSAGAVLSLFRAQAHAAPSPAARAQLGVFATLKSQRWTWLGLCGVAVSNGIWGVCYVVGLPLLVQSLGRGPAVFGALIAIYGVGNLIAALTFGAIPLTRSHRLCFAALGLAGFGYTLLGVAGSLWAMSAGLLVASVSGPLMNLWYLARLQQIAPPSELGKGYANFMVSSAAGASLGNAVAAVLFSAWGVRHGILISSAMVLAYSGAGLAWTATRREPATAVPA